MRIPGLSVLLPFGEAGVYDMSKLERLFLDLRGKEEDRCGNVLENEPVFII